MGIDAVFAIAKSIEIRLKKDDYKLKAAGLKRMTDRWPDDSPADDITRVLRAEREWWVQAYEALLAERDQQNAVWQLEALAWQQAASESMRVKAAEEIRLAEAEWKKENDAVKQQLELEIAKQSQERSALEDQLRNTSDEILDLKRNIEKNASSNEAQERKLKKKIEELDSSNRLLAESLRKATETPIPAPPSSHENETRDLKATIEEKDRAIQHLEDKVRELDSSARESQELSGNLQERIVALENELTAKHRNVEERDSHIDGLMREIRALKETKPALQPLPPVANDKLDQKEKILNLEENVRSLTYQKEMLEKQLRDCQLRIQLNESELDNLNKLSQQRQAAVNSPVTRTQTLSAARTTKSGK